jgi:acyl carrier protein
MFPDGRLECLGRIDHQVKIHGYRIELGEIESVLRAVPAVTEVLVVAHRIGDGDPALVAYWTGAAERDELRSAARARLPSYMVPTAFVSLPAFPLNTNGKIDRKALPPPTEVEPSSIPVLPPRNALEERIASVFARVLGVPAIGVDQSFFDLGGTSILAAEAIAKLDEDLGSNLPLRLLFEHPTVEGLAGRLDEPGSQDEPIAIVLQKGRAGEPPLMCLFGVRLYSDLALAMTDGTPVIGMHVPVRYLRASNRDRRWRPTWSATSDSSASTRAGPYQSRGALLLRSKPTRSRGALRAEGNTIALVFVIDAVQPGGIPSDSQGLARSMVRGSSRIPVGLTRRVVQRARALAEPRLGRLPSSGRYWGWAAAAPRRCSPVRSTSPCTPRTRRDIAAFAATGPHCTQAHGLSRLRNTVAMGRRASTSRWAGAASPGERREGSRRVTREP